MVTFTFENGCVATLRTSGTEPKIKYYTEHKPDPKKGQVKILLQPRHGTYNGTTLGIYIYIDIYIYTTFEKPVNDQSYGVLDRYGITILYK